MGTKYISSQFEESSSIVPALPHDLVSLMAPPGFSPLTKFSLQKVQNNTSDALQISVSNDASIIDEGWLKRSFQQKPWLSCRLDNCLDCCSNEEDDDPELLDSDIPVLQCLPKGVFRGCSECANCQTVRAQWRPEESCRPVLDEAPAFYPTEEEFKDTLKYIASIRPKAEPYGICRIIPPSTWKPPCPLMEKNVWTNSKFSTQVHKINMLQNRESYKKRCSNLNSLKNKRRKLLESDEHQSRYDSSAETNYDAYSNFHFDSGPDFTFQSFEEYAKEFKEQYFQTIKGEPSLEEIEGEYWRIVERPTEEIEVLYGSDLETGIFGSGFPKTSSLTNSEDQYLKSGWNLNNLPRLSGSMLVFEREDISGITIPWLYVGMCFSSFCWHVEDHHLYSMNYLHLGSPKMWYAVPGDNALKFEKTLKKHLPDLFQEQPDLLHKLVTQFSPSLLKKEGVPVYRCLQNAGEFVMTFPRAYHSGFNCGFNCAEAVNVAPIDWLPHGQNAVEIYSQQQRRITLSHDKLLLEAAKEAVRAQWRINFLRQNTVDNLRWKDASNGDGILAKALKDRIKMERLRRELLAPPQSQKMDAHFDANSERECAICNYDLHLSAVFCPCLPDRYTCLSHSKDLCSCSWSSKVSLYRYEIDELNTLLDAVSGKLSAIYRWGLSHLGLAFSPSSQEKESESFVSRQKTPKLNLPVISSKTKVHNRNSKIVVTDNAIVLDIDDNEPPLAILTSPKAKESPSAAYSNNKQAFVGSVTNDQIQVKSTEVVAHANANSEEVTEMKCGNQLITQTQTSLLVANKNTLPSSPMMTKDEQKNHLDVEVLDFGVALPGRLWSSSQAIFPKGFKSRVSYFNVLEPTQMCYYISQILDAGLPGPLFMVSIESFPSEIFVHYTATTCWDLIRERLNSEIRKQQQLKKGNLPALQPIGSVSGLEMFGLTLPSINQDVEATDPCHCCVEYWSSRAQVSTSMPVSKKNEEVHIQGILNKCSQEELQALHRQLNSEHPDARRELNDMIEQDIKRNRLL